MKTSNVMLCMLIMILSSNVLFAQSATEKGRIITDVDFLFNSNRLKLDGNPDFEIDHSTMDVEIGIGYTVIDDLEVGLHIRVDNDSIEMSGNKATENTLTYGIFTRYYLMPEQKIRPFVGITGGLGTLKTTSTGVADGKTNVTTFSGILGVSYFINTHVGVELLCQYLILSLSDDDDHPFTSDMSSTGFYIV
jgi:outer membrane protein W